MAELTRKTGKHHLPAQIVGGRNVLASGTLVTSSNSLEFDLTDDLRVLLLFHSDPSKAGDAIEINERDSKTLIFNLYNWASFAAGFEGAIELDKGKILVVALYIQLNTNQPERLVRSIQYTVTSGN